MSSKTFSETLTQVFTFFHGINDPAPANKTTSKEFEAFHDAAPRLEDFEALSTKNTLPANEQALRDAQVKRQAEPIISSYLSTAMISAVCYESQRRTGTYVPTKEEDPNDPSSTRNSSIAHASYEFVANLVEVEFARFLAPHKTTIRAALGRNDARWEKKSEKAQNKAIDEELDLRIKNAHENLEKNASTEEDRALLTSLPDKLDSAWREEIKRSIKTECLGLLFKHTPDAEHQHDSIKQIFAHIQKAVPAALNPIDKLLSKEPVIREPYNHIQALYPGEKQQKYSDKIYAKECIFAYFTSAIPERVMDKLFLSALTKSLKSHPNRFLAGHEADIDDSKTRDELARDLLDTAQRKLIEQSRILNDQALQSNKTAELQHGAPVSKMTTVGPDAAYNELLELLASHTQRAYTPRATDLQQRQGILEILNNNENFKGSAEKNLFSVFCDAISQIQTTAGLEILLDELDGLLTEVEKEQYLKGFVRDIKSELVASKNKSLAQIEQSLSTIISRSYGDQNPRRSLSETVSKLMSALPNYVRYENSEKDDAHEAALLALRIEDTAEELEAAVIAKQTRKRIAYAISTLLAATGVTLLLMTFFSPIAIPSMIFGFILLAAVTGYLATYSNYSLNSRRTFGKSQALIIAATTAALLMANAISLGAGWMLLFGFCGFSANLLLYRTDVPALLKAITPEWDVREWDWSLAGIANKLVNLVLFSMSAVTGYVFTMAMMTSIFILLAKTSLVALSIVGAPYITIPIFLVALLCNISFAHRGFLKLKNRVIDAWNGINTGAKKPEVIPVNGHEDDYKYMRDFENKKITGFKAVGFMLLNLLFFIQPTDSVEQRVVKVIASLCLILPLLALVTWFSQQPMVTSLIIKIVGFHIPNALSYLAPLYLPVVQLQSVLLILAATQRITIFIDKIRTVFYTASTALLDYLSPKFSSTKNAKNDDSRPLTQATKEKNFTFQERVRQKLLNEDHEIWAAKFHGFCPTTESDDSDQQHAAYLRHIYAVALWQHASLFDKAYAYLKAIVETAFNTLAPVLILVNGAANGVMAENGIPADHPDLKDIALTCNSISSCGASGPAFIENLQKSNATNKFRAPLMTLLTPSSTPHRERTPSPAQPQKSQSAPPQPQSLAPAATGTGAGARISSSDDTKIYAPPSADADRKAVTTSYGGDNDAENNGNPMVARSHGAVALAGQQEKPKLTSQPSSTRRDRSKNPWRASNCNTNNTRRSADDANASTTASSTVSRPSSEYTPPAVMAHN